MTTEQPRHSPPELALARCADRFAVWGWTAWIFGIWCWLFVLFLAYPVLWTLAHGKLPPLTLVVGIRVGVYLVFTLIALPALALYASSILFVVLSAADDRITVGRWFGLRRRVYHASDIAGWYLVDRRVRPVADVRAALRLRIDFLDGSWVGMSRWSWNFRKLEAWLRERAAWEAAASTAPRRALTWTYQFTVRDVGMTLLALTGWGLCWTIGARYIADVLSGKLRPPTDVGGFVVLALALVPVILGPLCVHLLGTNVHVNAPRIRVDRWFGLIRQTYHEDDIQRWRVWVDANPPWFDRSLLLSFADGRRVYVTSAAVNFRGFREYLRDRVPAREQVGRSRRSDETRRKATA